MIYLAHVRDLNGARHWLARRRRHLQANPVPLLVVTATADHESVHQIMAHDNVRCFIVDASGRRAHPAGRDTYIVDGPSRLDGAAPFIRRAQNARQRLDLLYIDAAPHPDLAWCEPHITQFEALV